MPGTPRSSTPAAAATPRLGWDNPEAVAAFYRLRSQSLQDSHTTAVPAKPAAPPPPQPMGLWEYLTSALAGRPGQR